MIAGFYSHLVNAGITKVFPQEAPSSTSFPYVTYHIASVDRGRHLKGSDGLDTSRVEVKIFGAAYASAKTLRDSVVGAIGLNGFRGTWAGKTVQLARWDDENEEYESPIDGSPSGAHEITLQLIVWHQP